MNKFSYKKLAVYVLIGVVSSLFTIGAITYISGKNESIMDRFTSNGKSSSIFTSSSINNSSMVVPDFSGAADKTINSVVSIKSYSDASNNRNQRGYSNPFDDFFFGNPFNDFFGAPENQNNQRRPQEAPDNNEDLPMGLGSGVIISSDGYIVTNNHVISNSNKLEITLNNNKTYSAEVIGADPNTDIALIKIDDKNLPFLSFYDSDKSRIGEWVLAVGNPFGLTSTVTAGIISATSRNLDILNSKSPIESFIQTDAVINPGNSGGALVNVNGDLIGINTAISSHSGSGSFEGYGFAVPSNIARKVVEDIKKYGVVQRAYIGVQGFDLSNSVQLNKYNKDNKTNYKTGIGIVVTNISPDSGAKDAGINKGDIIVEADGKRLDNFAKLQGVIGEKRPGDMVSLVILRGNSKLNFTVKLKDAKGGLKARTKDDMTVSERLGVGFESIDEKDKISYGIDSGVLVKELSSSSVLREIGIREGYVILQINDKKVNSEKDVNSILNKYKGIVSLDYLDQDGRKYRRGFKM